MSELDKVKQQIWEKRLSLFYLRQKQQWKNYEKEVMEPYVKLSVVEKVLGEWQKQLGELLIDKRPKVEIRGENITWEDVYEWQKQLQKLIFGVEVERELGLK